MYTQQGLLSVLPLGALLGPGALQTSKQVVGLLNLRTRIAGSTVTEGADQSESEPMCNVEGTPKSASSPPAQELQFLHTRERALHPGKKTQIFMPTRRKPKKPPAPGNLYNARIPSA